MIESLEQIWRDRALPHIVVVGDIILDEYLYGAVGRISPEAPVPVLQSSRNHAVLGGAANVANNLAALGCQVTLVGILGEDAPGERLRALLKSAGVGADGILVDADRPTTHKLRIVAQRQQMLRIDRELCQPIDAAQVEIALNLIRPHLLNADVVVLSDYAKGFVTGPLTQAVIALASGRNLPVLVDPKGTDYTRYRNVAALTPNLHELEVAAGSSVNTPEGLEKAARIVLDQTQAKALLVTCGADGMKVFAPACSPIHIPAQAREVFDVTGAGDTVIAVFALGIARGLEFVAAARVANAAAGLVVGKMGTATISRVELWDAVAGAEASPEGKIVDLSALVDRVTAARRAGKRIVFTNGCFDLLHAGHVAYLQQARREGDVLVVGLNSDASVKKLKGPERPLVPERERAQVLAALEAVTYITVFADETPANIIEHLRPDVLVKGADYAPDQVVGRQTVESYGGRLVLVPLVKGQSTSGLIAAIAAKFGARSH